MDNLKTTVQQVLPLRLAAEEPGTTYTPIQEEGLCSKNKHVYSPLNGY